MSSVSRVCIEHADETCTKLSAHALRTPQTPSSNLDSCHHHSNQHTHHSITNTPLTHASTSRERQHTCNVKVNGKMEILTPCKSETP